MRFNDRLAAMSLACVAPKRSQHEKTWQRRRQIFYGQGGSKASCKNDWQKVARNRSLERCFCTQLRDRKVSAVWVSDFVGIIIAKGFHSRFPESRSKTTLIIQLLPSGPSFWELSRKGRNFNNNFPFDMKVERQKTRKIDSGALLK